MKLFKDIWKHFPGGRWPYKVSLGHVMSSRGDGICAHTTMVADEVGMGPRGVCKKCERKVVSAFALLCAWRAGEYPGSAFDRATWINSVNAALGPWGLRINRDGHEMYVVEEMK